MQGIEPEPEALHRSILEALAVVRVSSYPSIIEGADDGGSSVSITAKEVTAVGAILEERLKCGYLLEPKDYGKQGKQANSCLSPIEGMTVEELGKVVMSKLTKRRQE